MPEPIPSVLDEHARDVTGTALQSILVDLIDLALVGKQAHWNLVGRQFHDMHLHLDELVSLARTYADEVAERAASIGVPPDGRAVTVSSNSGIPGLKEGWVKDRDVANNLSALSQQRMNQQSTLSVHRCLLSEVVRSVKELSARRIHRRQ